ncbi:mycothiol transferase [Kribbella turkmenica]|uniref:mycothiol transferase n=1 Tax=Kribbella turkmenica TaxID=2530375 RepID=UPI0022776D89|nr:DUF664 domain-containing protein [Kribbella turkmenica]
MNASVKEELHQALRQARAGVLQTVEGLPEYSLRRPVTPTGTNLLGMVKHLGSQEYGYLGEAFGRPASGGCASRDRLAS